MHYLGHIISVEGISIDLKKIKVIMEWSVPQNVSEFGSFMGLMRYYRKFVQWFSQIVSPITSLQRKGMRFEWTEKCEQTFQLHEERFTTTPVLTIPNPNGRFIVIIDASRDGLGVVLIQDKHVVAYESRKLKQHEVNYAPHDL